MAYGISTALAIYFVLWWVTLFLTLPFGVRSQHEDGEGAPGTDPGAPIMAKMGRKLIWTTVLSAVFYGIGLWAYQAGYLSVERLSKLFLTKTVFAMMLAISGVSLTPAAGKPKNTKNSCTMNGVLRNSST